MWWCLVLVLAAAETATSLPELLAQVQRMIARSDRAAARKELVRASQLHPGSPAVANFFGVLEAEEGNYGAAEARFRMALQKAPRYTDAYLNLGRLYQQNVGKDAESVRKAIGVYHAVLGYDPGHAEANYQSAVLLQATGDFKRSLEHLSRLPAAAQESAQALAIRCADLAGIGERGEAESAANRLLGHPDLSELDVLSAVPTLSAQGRDDLALRLLGGLRARGLASPEAMRQLGLGHESQGALDRAREALEASTQGRPASAEVLTELARVAHKQRDYRGALGYLAHARDIAPQDPRIHFFFGMVCVDLGLGQEAHNSLMEAVRLAPDNPYVNYALGAASMHKRDPAEAVPYFRRYVELKPDDPRGRFTMGIALFRAGSFPAAREELARAVLHPETAAGAHYFLARMAREENDLAPALREAQKAIDADPRYADAWAELGLLHLRSREYTQAEKALQRCLEIDPDSHLGNLHLLMLWQRTKDARGEAQEQRFEELKKRLQEKTEDFFRVIEVRPY